MRKFKPYKLKSLLIVTGFICLFFSCSQKHKVDYVIPPELQGQAEVIEAMDEMAEAVGECQLAMQKAVKFAIGLEKGQTDSLSMGQGIKGAFAVSKVMLAKKHMDEAKEKADLLKKDLSVLQIAVLDSVFKSLESHIGDINPEELGLSEEELAELKAGGNLNFGNMEEESPRSQAAKDSIEAEAAYIAEQHRLHDEYLKSQGLYEEPKTQSKAVETPMWVGIAFPILVLLLMGTFFVIKIKRFIKGVKRVANDVSYAKSKFKK